MLARSASRCVLLAAVGDGYEIWTYELPSLTLRERETWRAGGL